MSSSSSTAVALGETTRTPGRSRIIRGLTLPRHTSPLEAELAAPAAPVDPAVAAAEEQRGYDDGYRAGMAEGLAAGRTAMAAESAAAAARLEGLIAALADAATDLRSRQGLDLAGLEDALARTAVDLAAAIIGRELEVSASPGADALARALALVPAGVTAIARLHPTDAALLDGDRPSSALIAPDSAAPGRPVSVPAGVTIVPDPAIEPGGCILEVGDSRIDAQLGSALDRVRAALRGDRA
jgi:flagellar assembly protein FliH